MFCSCGGDCVSNSLGWPPAARPLQLNVESSNGWTYPLPLLSFSVLVAVAVECDVFHDTFPWDYSTHNILFPFCYAGSQSSTMSHQLRTNQRDPSYPHSINKRDVLNDIRHSTIHHFHRFLGSRSNHSSIHSTILMRLLFFHASHFPVRDWSSPQPSFCCLVDSLRLYTRTVLYLFLPPANLLYSYPSSSCWSTPTPTIESTNRSPNHRQPALFVTALLRAIAHWVCDINTPHNIVLRRVVPKCNETSYNMP